MLFKSLSKLGFLFVLSLLVSCSEDDSVKDLSKETQTSSTTVYITDAPIDDANVEAVFVTVSAVRVNGMNLEGFNKTTVQLSALTNGNTQSLGELDLNTGTTSEIVLVLSETDESGSGPGNYLITRGGSKQKLSGALELSLRDQAQIVEAAQNQIILDFDLRKSLREENGNYSFVSRSQLENNIRAVNEINTGIVKGNIDNTSEGQGEVIVAYAYKEGSYSQSETNPNNEGVEFSNAVSSSIVSESNGEFEIHFLEEGDYELHFASYNDNDNDGNLEFSGMVDANAVGSINLNGFNIEANSEVNLQISFEGLLGL